MKKSGKTTWMPLAVTKSHRSASNGRIIAAKSGTIREGGSDKGDGKPHIKSVASSSLLSSGKTKAEVSGSGVTRRFALPNRTVISSVRSDVMDRALSRGEFKKK
jgi:hypothetical protein